MSIDEQHTAQGLTLKEAAAQLGVSVKTLRRWIKAGQLQATLVQGPYGEEYRVPEEAITTAQQIVDVVAVQRTNDPKTLAMAVSKAIQEREAVLLEEIQQLRDTLTTELSSVHTKLETLDTGIATYVTELGAMREERDQERQRRAAAEREARRLESERDALQAQLERLEPPETAEAAQDEPQAVRRGYNIPETERRSWWQRLLRRG